MRVLLIDKDRTFNQAFSFFLKNRGVIVDSSFSGEDGFELIRLYDYDVILTDSMLPDISGEEFLRKLRLSGNKTPVIIVSGPVSAAQKVECFRLGADDYVVRPCDKGELFARMQAVVRRTRGYAHPVVQVGEMSVNLENKEVTIGGRVLALTAKEYALVELLALRQGQTVSKEQFLNYLYGGMDEPEIKIIDVFLCRIRRKIVRLSGGKQYIQTLWGRGYVLKDSPVKAE